MLAIPGDYWAVYYCKSLLRACFESSIGSQAMITYLNRGVLHSLNTNTNYSKIYISIFVFKVDKHF